jgi:hypothetical protein
MRKKIVKRLSICLVLSFILYETLNRFRVYRIKPILDKNSKYRSFESQCECKRFENIILHFANLSISIKNAATNKFSQYSLSKQQHFNMNFTCNPYNEFKRGPHQKVISYSLYGKDASYYKQLKNITLSVKKLYPGWLVRVYHDNSINTGIICEVECQRDKETNALIDNTDFCNVEELYLNLENLHANKIFNLKYVHAMMWRWFPLYDNFVDTFSSRDSDSFILKRELESVNVWLNSFNIGHIMRGIFNSI